MTEERWVFLRGLARRKEHWGDFLERFAGSRPGVEIEALDLAGNGSERHRNAFAQMEAYVEDLRSRSQLLKKGPVRLVAISLGGMVAADWASRYPAEITSLHLINTSARGSAAFWERLRPSNYAGLAGILLRRPEALEREEQILSMVSNLEETRRAHWARRFAQLEPCSPQNFLRQLTAALRFCPSGTAPGMPVTLLCSRGDRFVSSVCSQRMAQLWGARLEEHPHAGHDLPLDDPEWVTQKILETVPS
jgi:pimeloyl-ACP methyl ester carboxylesterase